ncbi:MAG: polysaccharide deacetylase family protein [Gemmatimonadaceae bacterium]|nr:polysaccharide deacetylase family protein [Gemmatimonadaceae bacterium]
MRPAFLTRPPFRHVFPLREGGLAVLGYHRVGDPARTAWDPDLFSSTADELDRHIGYLKRVHGIVGSDEALQLLAGRRSGNPGGVPPVLLTFDDGYLDNYTTAYPVLAAHGVSATFFLVVDYVRGATVPWWDSIAWMCRRARGEGELDGDVALEARREAAALIASYKSLDAESARAMLEGLPARLGVAAPTNARELFLSVEQAREMVRGGMTIGAHTRTHPILGKLPREQQRDELRSGKAWLERELGCKVATLAYPVGSSDAFTEETMREARRAGYRACFSFHGGINDLAHTDVRDVKRIPVYFGVPDDDLVRPD